MKISKCFEANNEMIGWKEIESMISDTYETRNAVDKLIEIFPEVKLKVTYKLEIEVE